MSYMSSKDTKEIRKRIGQEYPDYKFSVVTRHHSTVSVSIMESPIEFKDFFRHSDSEFNELDAECYASSNGYTQLNPFYPNRYVKEVCAVMSGIMDIIHDVCGDQSDEYDPYADYNNSNYYVNINVGKWDCPYVCKESKSTVMEWMS